HVLSDPQTGFAPTWAAAVHHLSATARDGDGVAAHPFELRFPVRWYVGGPGYGEMLAVPMRDTDAFVRGDTAWNGRLWIFESTSDTTSPPGWVACGAPFDRSGYRIACWMRPASG